MDLLAWCCALPLALVLGLVAWARVPVVRQVVGCVTIVVLAVGCVWRLGELAVQVLDHDVLRSRDGMLAECGSAQSTLEDGDRRESYVASRSVVLTPGSIASHRPPGWVDVPIGPVDRWFVERGDLISYTAQTDTGPQLGLLWAPAPDEGPLPTVASIDVSAVTRTRSTTARWWRVVGDTIVIHTDQDGGALELLEVDLVPRGRVVGLGELPDDPLRMLPTHDGGMWILVSRPGEVTHVLRVSPDGTWASTPLRVEGSSWISDARDGGLCVSNAQGEMFQLAGDPPALTAWSTDAMVSDRSTPLALSLFAAMLLVAGLGALAFRGRMLVAVTHGIEGTIDWRDGQLHWAGPDGVAHPVLDYDRWLPALGAPPSRAPTQGPALATRITSATDGATRAGDGAYRTQPNAVRIGLLVGGHRDTARQAVLTHLLEWLALVGAALLLSAGPALALSLAAA